MLHYLHLVGNSNRIPKNPNSKTIQSQFFGLLIHGFIIHMIMRFAGEMFHFHKCKYLVTNIILQACF
jgi:hypothetical protein